MPLRRQVFEQAQAVAPGHHHVGENQIEAVGLRQFQRPRRVVAHRRLMAL